MKQNMMALCRNSAFCSNPVGENGENKHMYNKSSINSEKVPSVLIKCRAKNIHIRDSPFLWGYLTNLFHLDNPSE